MFVKTKVINTGSQLKVTVGTKYDGLNSDSSTTLFKLENQSGFCWDIKPGNDSIELELRGGWELEAFIEAMRFSIATLEQQMQEKIEEVKIHEVV